MKIHMKFKNNHSKFNIFSEQYKTEDLKNFCKIIIKDKIYKLQRSYYFYDFHEDEITVTISFNEAILKKSITFENMFANNKFLISVTGFSTLENIKINNMKKMFFLCNSLYLFLLFFNIY